MSHQTLCGFHSQIHLGQLNPNGSFSTPHFLAYGSSERKTRVFFSLHNEGEVEHEHLGGIQGRQELFGGIEKDLKRRLPHYVSDFRDGLHPKAASSVLFLYFACLAPCIAFGGLMSHVTGGHIGVVETLVGTSGIYTNLCISSSFQHVNVYFFNWSISQVY